MSLTTSTRPDGPDHDPTMLPLGESSAIVEDICDKLNQDDESVKDFVSKVANKLDDLPKIIEKFPQTIKDQLMKSAEVTSSEELMSKFGSALPTEEQLKECLNDKDTIKTLTENIKNGNNKKHFEEMFREFEKNPEQTKEMMKQMEGMKDLITPEMMAQFVPSRRERRRARRRGLVLPEKEKKAEEPETFTCLRITGSRKIKQVKYKDDCWDFLGPEMKKSEIEYQGRNLILYFNPGKNRRIRRLFGVKAEEILIVEIDTNLTAEDVLAWEK